MRRSRDRGWGGEAADPITTRLEALGPTSAEVDARIARHRLVLRAAFTEARARPTRDRSGILPRRFALAVAAGLLLVAGTAGGLAASAPGLPLYGLRLASEEFLLPAREEARLTAQLDRLDRRLGEAAAGLASADASAVSAALAAYDAIAADLRGGPPPTEGQRATAMSRMSEQVRHLLALGRQDAPAAGALRSARGVQAWLTVPPPADVPSSAAPTSPSPAGRATSPATRAPDPSAQGEPADGGSVTPPASAAPAGPDGTDGTDGSGGHVGPSASAPGAPATRATGTRPH